jgi:hypothetical protein
MKNQTKRYEGLIREVFLELYGEYDDGNPHHADEMVEMLDYFETDERLPGLYAADRADWIKARAAQWREHRDPAAHAGLVREMEAEYYAALQANPGWKRPTLFDYLVERGIVEDDIWDYSPQIGYDAGKPEPDWL